MWRLAQSSLFDMLWVLTWEARPIRLSVDVAPVQWAEDRDPWTRSGVTVLTAFCGAGWMR